MVYYGLGLRAPTRGSAQRDDLLLYTEGDDVRAGFVVQAFRLVRHEPRQDECFFLIHPLGNTAAPSRFSLGTARVGDVVQRLEWRAFLGTYCWYALDHGLIQVVGMRGAE